MRWAIKQQRKWASPNMDDFEMGSTNVLKDAKASLTETIDKFQADLNTILYQSAHLRD